MNQEPKTLEAFIERLGEVVDMDPRQDKKVIYPLGSIIFVCVAATACNAKTWVDKESFCDGYFDILTEYVHLPDVPSHDTLQRIMMTVDPDIIAELQRLWSTEFLGIEEEDITEEQPESLQIDGEKLLHRIIDGKEMRGSKRVGCDDKVHNVTLYAAESKICLVQEVVPKKRNERAAIMNLLKTGYIGPGTVTSIDAIATYKYIAKEIVQARGYYVLPVKKNQPSLDDAVQARFAEPGLEEQLKEKGHYLRTEEKVRGQLEIREYFMTDDLGKWLHLKGWADLKTIGMVRTTIIKDEKETVSYRFYISNLPVNIAVFERVVRGHWGVEQMHFQLDYTLNEDNDRTAHTIEARNMNIIRKWSLVLVENLEYETRRKSKLSNRNKLYLNSTVKFVKNVLEALVPAELRPKQNYA